MFLFEGEKSVSEIEKMLKLRQPAVSQQLARLRADGLVETRRNGKNIYYSLARSEVRDVIQVLHDVFATRGKRVSAMIPKSGKRPSDQCNRDRRL